MNLGPTIKNHPPPKCRTNPKIEIRNECNYLKIIEILCIVPIRKPKSEMKVILMRKLHLIFVGCARKNKQ